ncbi:MAG: hypothetical protein ACOWWR_20150 [Eubacteriales bacterium]
MKNTIEKKLNESKESLIHLSKSIFNDDQDNLKLLVQFFRNHNIHVDKIPYKDTNALISTSNNKDSPTIIFPFMLYSQNKLLNRWKNSIVTPIIMGAFIGLHSIEKEINCHLIAIGIPSESSMKSDQLLAYFEGTASCIFIDIAEHTRESGSSMNFKTIKIQFKDTLFQQGKEKLRFSNPIDAQLSFIHTLNMLKLNISEEIFIEYKIHEMDIEIFSKPKIASMTVAISSSNEDWVEEIMEILQDVASKTAEMLKVKEHIQLGTTVYHQFHNNDPLNRIFCHNLKEKGFIEILPYQNTNMGLHLSHISHKTPCIFPTVGFQAIPIQNDIHLKQRGIISDESAETIINAANAYAYTLYDIIHKPELLNEVYAYFQRFN